MKRTKLPQEIRKIQFERIYNLCCCNVYGRKFIRIEQDAGNYKIAKSCSYDRIIVTSAMNAKFTGEAGVLRFDEIYELDCEPKKVSDHYPVYSVFRVK